MKSNSLNRLWVTLMGAAVGATGLTAKPITLPDFFALKRVSDPQISPDGKSIAYVVGTPDLTENRTQSDIWIAGIDGSDARPLAAYAYQH